MYPPSVGAWLPVPPTAPATFILPEKSLRLPSWARFKKPVVRLWKALYGHPDARTYWEQHCNNKVVEAGFEPMINWPSCFFHPVTKLMCTVYVDDFLLSGPTERLGPGWASLRRDSTEYPGLNIEQEKYVGADNESSPGKRDGKTLYLGCYRSITKEIKNGTEVRTMHYEMKDFLESSCELFETLAQQCNYSVSWRSADTPFRPEDNKCNPASMPLHEGPGSTCCP